jgi:hypothetical protein
MESNQWLMECSRLVRRSFRLNSQLQDKDRTSPLQASTTGRSRADLHNKTLQGLDHASHHGLSLRQRRRQYTIALNTCHGRRCSQMSPKLFRSAEWLLRLDRCWTDACLSRHHIHCRQFSGCILRCDRVEPRHDQRRSVPISDV